VTVKVFWAKLGHFIIEIAPIVQYNYRKNKIIHLRRNFFRMDDIERLKQKIEKSRKNLMKVAENRKLSDPEVVGASRLLDTILNEYEILLARKKV
jgi:hypothetical protein